LSTPTNGSPCDSFDARSSHGRIVGIADVDRACLDLSIIDTKVPGQTGMTPDEIYAGVAAADRHVDYRRLLDDKRIGVILIGTPDHWHSKMLIDAVKAGKDVYCEKPLTLTIDEGKEIRKAVAASDRIVQVGSWHRSDHRFRTAVEMVRQGRIGKLERVEVVLGKNDVGGPFQPRPVPATLDWNQWQGQTPDVPYVPERCHFTSDSPQIVGPFQLLGAARPRLLSEGVDLSHNALDDLVRQRLQFLCGGPADPHLMHGDGLSSAGRPSRGGLGPRPTSRSAPVHATWQSRHQECLPRNRGPDADRSSRPSAGRVRRTGISRLGSCEPLACE
jgi:hypothetical protein